MARYLLHLTLVLAATALAYTAFTLVPSGGVIVPVAQLPGWMAMLLAGALVTAALVVVYGSWSPLFDQQPTSCGVVVPPATTLETLVTFLPLLAGLAAAALGLLPHAQWISGALLVISILGTITLYQRLPAYLDKATGDVHVGSAAWAHACSLVALVALPRVLHTSSSFGWAAGAFGFAALLLVPWCAAGITATASLLQPHTSALLRRIRGQQAAPPEGVVPFDRAARRKDAQ